MRRSLEGVEPTVADSAYVDPTAVLIGDVRVEHEASIWPNATLRGDCGAIVVGERSNVQDNAVVHENAVLERAVTVGHGAIVHDATVRAGALIGMNAVVLDDARVGPGAVVAAGSVVTEGTEVPAETLVAGSPAAVKTDIDDPELAGTADRYVERARRHAAHAERLPPETGGDS